MARPARKTDSDVHAPARVWLLPDVHDRNRDPEFAWLREHAHEYPGEWVVVDGDMLVAHGTDLDAIYALLTPEQIESALFHRVLPA